VKYGNPWIAAIEHSTGKKYLHTFVVAGFEKGVACLALVSNFETLTDQRPSIRDQLTVSSMQPVRRSRVVVTGQPSAVDRTARRALERAAGCYRDRPQRVRHLLAECNATASQSARPPDSISRDCAVFSLDRGGTGYLTLTAPKSIEWHDMMFGVAVPDALEIAKQLGISNPRLVQAATVTSFGQQRFATEAVPCRVTSAVPERSPYSVVELLSPGHVNSWCRGLNSRSAVIGAGSTRETPGEANLWTWHDGQFVDLGLSVTNSGAMAINDAGSVGGAYSHGVGTLHPFLVRKGALVELMPGGDVDAAVKALAQDDTAVGWISRSRLDRGQRHWRPAIWRSSGPPEVLDDIPADWGTADAINQRGETLLSLHRGMQPLTGVLFDGQVFLPGRTGLPGFIAMGLDDLGRVLGFVNDAEGQQVAYLWTSEAGVQNLGTASGWLPCAISPSGWIVGSFREAGFERPWVRAPDGAIDLLPFLPDHHCRPADVNDSGHVVGTCSADGHQHAMYWPRIAEAETSFLVNNTL
jgi:hypothetical protein